MRNETYITEDSVSLMEKVSFLRRPGSYPHRVRKVETKETHMSWIFLVNDTVYKLKKPVAFPYLDFRSLESRLTYCREELRLNHRLAPGIYLGLSALVVNLQGNLSLEGEGRVVDYLVRMKRIPDAGLLDYAIEHGTVNDEQLERVSVLLSKFYMHAPPVQVEEDLFRRKLQDDILSTETELFHPIFDFDAVLLEGVCRILLSFLSAHSSLLGERIRHGRIIEAHGDLRPEHVCLWPEPAIIDALEFSRELRIMDIAEELSFLDMECEMLGDANTGRAIMNRYIRESGDEIPEPLIYFYKARKAFLRAYLKARHVLEPGYRDDPKWLRKGNDYLRLAGKYANLLKQD